MDDAERDAQFDRLAACQTVMLAAAEVLGFTAREIAGAGIMTAALAFAQSPESGAREGFIHVAANGYDLAVDMLRAMAVRATPDPAGLAEREPQGGVS